MLLKEFSKKVSTKSLNENLAKQFGTKIDVSKFTTEQLEDARNKIRTKSVSYTHQTLPTNREE